MPDICVRGSKRRGGVAASSEKVHQHCYRGGHRTGRPGHDNDDNDDDNDNDETDLPDHSAQAGDVEAVLDTALLQPRHQGEAQRTSSENISTR